MFKLHVIHIPQSFEIKRHVVRSIRSNPTTCFATRGVELFENAKKSEIENASHAKFSEKSRLKARKRCQRL